jgi:uncharacterized protein CbrC (UPF0167 family)
MADAYCQFAADKPRHYRLMFDLEQSALPTEPLAEHPVGEILNRTTRIRAWTPGNWPSCCGRPCTAT